MSETVRLYGCGCLDGPEGFEPCRKARRLEDRMHDAELTVQGCASNASWLAQYLLTYNDPEYFERGRSVMDHADNYPITRNTPSWPPAKRRPAAATGVLNT